MGCFQSREEDVLGAQDLSVKQNAGAQFQKPKWRSEQPLTADRLKAMREEFWDTQPHYGGNKVIWDNLKAACEADVATARLIIEAAAIVVSAITPMIGIFYDERGAKYELPNYVMSDPVNVQPAEPEPMAAPLPAAAL